MECDKIIQAIHYDDVSTIQQLLAEDVDVINADVLGVSIVKHNVWHHKMMGTVSDIICIALMVEGHHFTMNIISYFVKIILQEIQFLKFWCNQV